jgi:hypothetical protein
MTKTQAYLVADDLEQSLKTEGWVEDWKNWPWGKFLRKDGQEIEVSYDVYPIMGNNSWVATLTCFRSLEARRNNEYVRHMITTI